MLNYNKDIILIPAKGTSLRCPNKNLMLIDWAIDYLGDNVNRAILITDSDKLIEIAQKRGLKFYKSNIVDGDLNAMYDFLEKINYQRKYFIFLPLTQPLREIDLIDRLDNKETDKDFIVSSNRIVNRNIFNIEDNKFIYESFERKGCLCNSVNSIDGAIYKINFNFLGKAFLTDNINHYFWNGNFETINNNMPFLDIDEIEDLKCFYNLKQLFSNKKL
jgi:CMP-N-acetylneuraminic acid synthetase